jgi:F0F1-type ATP synthase assembly protein I
VAAAALGTYLQQSSYQAGDLSQALPAAAVLEPVVAVGLGIAILQEDIRSSGPEWILIGLSVVAMIAATASLARSQAAAEPAGAASPAPAPDAA